MSLEAELAANTAAIKELTAALLASGIVKNAQVTAEAHSSPAVKAVVKAQKDADAKKSKATPDTTPAADAQNVSGEQSAPTGEQSSSEPTGELQPWAGKTAAKFEELKDLEANLDNVRKAVLGINSLIGREQALAVLGRFGVQGVTPKDNKKGLDESQYPEFFDFCLDVLAGKVDATASVASE